MNTRTILFVACTLALVACRPSPGAIPPPEQSSSSSSVAIPEGDVIIESPKENALVISPLNVRGKARGFWFFEAQLTVQLTDARGNVIVSSPAMADGEWMTTDYVDFAAELTFATTAESGFLVIKKDNPSGLPEHDASVKIPVQF